MVKVQTALSVVAGLTVLQPVANGATTGHGQKSFGNRPAEKKDSEKKSPFTADFKARATDILGQWHVPGVSVAVVDGNDIFAKGFGLATLPDTQATAETLYYVGSTTKAHTAAVLAQLIDSKALPGLSRGWMTPISSLIRDDFVLQDQWATAHITLDDAVSHRTGMATHDNAWHREINGTQTTIKDVVRNIRNLPPSAEPRVEWRYCNSMYVTLSHVVETLTGRRLEDVMRDYIWNPLGMNSTYMNVKDAKASQNHLASSYVWREKEKKYDVMPFLGVEEISGAGGVISNVLDYAQWVKCLIHETKPFSKAVHKDIRTPRFLQNAQLGVGTELSLYGLAWFRTLIHGQVVYWHSGSTLTFGALVYWLPDLKFGIVALANGAGTSGPVNLILVRRLLEDKLRVPLQDRLDINKQQKERAAMAQRNLQKADDILFPNRPKPASPPSIKAAQLTGAYFNQGYGAIKLFEEPLSANSDKMVLVANRTELTWVQQWRLHHVSGDYWTLYSTMFGVELSTAYYAAEFKIGVDGKVAGLEVSMADQSGALSDGTVLFTKV